jgi:hypothetical protein
MNYDVFDPYHKWLGIRDKQRPPNHYRLLGLETFEDDVDVIGAAADQRIAHVRTYQLGPHSALSQKILNELATARLCLLDPSKRAAYNDRLRKELPQVAQPANHSTETDSTYTTIRSDPGATGTPEHHDTELTDSSPIQYPRVQQPRRGRRRESVRFNDASPAPHRMIPWSVAAATAIGIMAVLTVTIQFNPRSNRHSGQYQITTSQPASEPSFRPGSGGPPRGSPAVDGKADGAKPIPDVVDPRSASTQSGPATVSEEEPFRPVPPMKHWANLASELPAQLRASWGSDSAEVRQDVSQLLLCREIAQLAYANVAVAALTRPPTQELDDEISRALSRIDEFRASTSARPFFAELFSSMPTAASPARARNATSASRRETSHSAASINSWPDVDRCFEAYASAVARLNSILRDGPVERTTPETVTEHVEKTEQLFRTALAHIQSNVGKSSGTDDWASRLRSVESAAMIDSCTLQTGLQQICHWTLRLCEALCVYCECASPESASRVAQIGRELSRDDFTSGLQQLHALLLLELELWSLINEGPRSNS